jgi:hypothetical protein
MDDFLPSCFRALDQGGIWVGQMENIAQATSGGTPQISREFVSLVQRLEQAGFESVVDYAAHSNDLSLVPSKASTWFVVAMKDQASRTNWFRNEAEINVDIAKRSVLARPGEALFRHLDAATMMQYQFTSRVVEEAWCAASSSSSNRPITEGPTDAYCSLGRGFSPDLVVISSSALSVRPSAVANGGRGVYATQFMARGSVLALKDLVHVIFVTHRAAAYMSRLLKTIDESIATFWSVVYGKYLLGYGFHLTDHVRFLLQWPVW